MFRKWKLIKEKARRYDLVYGRLCQMRLDVIEEIGDEFSEALMPKPFERSMLAKLNSLIGKMNLLKPWE